jgi:hypothetical protein
MSSERYKSPPNCFVKFAMKKKTSSLKIQGNDNVIDVESVLFKEKCVVFVRTIFYVWSAMIYNRYRQINIDLCDPLIFSMKSIFFLIKDISP